MHEPYPNQYVWDGFADLERWMQLIQASCGPPGWQHSAACSVQCTVVVLRSAATQPGVAVPSVPVSLPIPLPQEAGLWVLLRHGPCE